MEPWLQEGMQLGVGVPQEHGRRDSLQGRGPGGGGGSGVGALAPHRPQPLLLLSRDTHIHPGPLTLHGQDHKVPRVIPTLRAIRHQAQRLGPQAALRPDRENMLPLTILVLKRPWLSSPTKVSFLGSDLASRCFLIPSTASR